MCSSPNPRILYVDDDPDACEMISLLLSLADDSFEVTAVSSAQSALNLIDNQAIALVILDYVLAGMSGVELCQRIRQTDSEIPIMFYSGMSREIDRSLALAAGANEYLVKPNDLDIFTDTAKRLLDESSGIYEVKTSISNNTH
jgi:DNA-binding response OmpR family regulator